MNLTDAIEALRGQSYNQILAILRQQTVPALGKIQGSQLKLLQSFIGATGLRNRLANATPEQAAAAAAVAEAIQPAYLAREDSYSINLADPQVAQLLTDAVSAGVLTASERAYLVQLATYQKTLWPQVTMRDVVSHFDPLVVDVGDWSELVPNESRRLMLQTTAQTPEPTVVRLEMCESHDGQHWTGWQRITPIVGVFDAGVYYQPIPHNGLQRKIRWRGEEYRISGTIGAV